MKQVSKSVIAISVLAGAAVLSFGWSEQRGVSLSIESAQARVGRPLTPVSVAGVARRHNRRAYGYGVAGAAAVGAAAVAANSYYGYNNPNAGYYAGSPYYQGSGYYTGGPYGAYGSYGYQDYATRNGFKCQPGTMVRLDDGKMYRCQ
jgi:hypothetical protein